MISKRTTPHDLRRCGTALGVGTVGSGGLTYGATRDKKKTAGVVGGGLAGQAAYQGAGYATTNYTRTRSGQSLRRSDLTDIASGKKPMGLLHPDLAEKKGWEKRMDQRRHHTATHTSGGSTNWKKVYREWPKDAPYSRASRVIGHTHNGKTGVALGAATTIGGAILGGHAARGKKQVVGKLYVKDHETSLTGLVGTGAGVALGAWGLGRSGMLGRALGHGINNAARGGNHNAFAVLQSAQAAQGVLRRGTAPGEHAMRQIRSIDRLIERVPAAIHPEIALAAGTLLVGNSSIRRDTYHPVNIKIRTGGF